jgi:hypothetical protein
MLGESLVQRFDAAKSLHQPKLRPRRGPASIAMPGSRRFLFVDVHPQLGKTRHQQTLPLMFSAPTTSMLPMQMPTPLAR